MDTALPLGLIEALERHYEMEKIIEAYRLEGGWWNDVFAVRTENRKYVVRVRHRTTLIESLHYEHALLSFMSKRIEEVPMPLPRRDGSTFFVHDERIVTMYPCMPGSIPDRHEPFIRTATAAMLARLHLAALDVPNVEPNPGHPSLAELNWDRNQSWDWHEVKQFLDNRLDERQALSEFDEQQLEYLAEIQKSRVEIEQQKERISAWLLHLSASRRELLLAPIHGDYYRGNLLCTGDRVTAVIDWDECKPEWLCYELARATWEFCKDLRHNDLNRQHAAEFIQAYKAAGGPVPFDEFDLIIPFVRCVRLMEVLFHLGLAAKGEPWDPEYTLHNWKSLLHLYHTEDLNWGDNNHLHMIRRQWDAYHPEYMEAILKERPDYYKFFAGGGVIDSFEFRLLGDVRGMRLLDTCCACDASQAFSWTNLGAKVTACDISEVAIEIAKNNAVMMGLDVEFQEADAQTLQPIADEAYDIVYATYLVWYEDIKKAFKTWHRVLKPGGRLLYAGPHPLAKLLHANGGLLEMTRRYHDRAPHYYRFDATAVGRRHGVDVNKPTVNFFHTLADIVNAISEAGFTIERMVETEAQSSTMKSYLPEEIAIVAKKHS